MSVPLPGRYHGMLSTEADIQVEAREYVVPSTWPRIDFPYHNAESTKTNL